MLAYLLGWYNLAGRSRTEYSLLSWREIKAWSELTDIQPRIWEMDALLRLDAVWIEVMTSKNPHAFEDMEDEAKK